MVNSAYRIEPRQGGLSCLQAGTWSTPALCDVIICITNKSGYGLRMYMYHLYIHFRIHIRFFVSWHIIRSISVCCVRVVMRMCLRQHDTTPKPGSQPKTCTSVLLTLCKGISLLCDEGLIDRFDCWFKIFILNTDDDIKLRRTLIDHLNIDTFVCKSSK